MKLLTKEILKHFQKQGDTSQMKPENIKIIAKFFNPQGSGTWYTTEYNPETKMFFGFVSIYNDYNDELGYFSLDELEQFRGKLGLGIERDRYCNLIDYKLQDILDGKRP